MFWVGLIVHIFSRFGISDETLAAYAERGTTYRLEEIAGEPALERIELSFPRNRRLEWRTACAVYRARIKVPYPWFSIRPIGMLALGCEASEAETGFRDALAAMTLAEAHGGILILSNDAGEVLVFRVQP